MTCIGLAQAKQQRQTKNVEKQQLCPLVSTLGLSGNRTNTCVVYHYLTQKKQKNKQKKKQKKRSSESCFGMLSSVGRGPSEGKATHHGKPLLPLIKRAHP